MKYVRYALLGSVGVGVGAFLACGPIGGSGTAQTSVVGGVSSSATNGTSSTAASAANGSSGSSAASSPSGIFVVNRSAVHQKIDGFGGADTWAPGGPLTAQEVQAFFDPANGIGLSLLRIGIDVTGQPLGGWHDIDMDILGASSFGAKVWAAPWSPPASEKDNDNENDGGHLCAAESGACAGDDYDVWAGALATFAQNVYTQTGVPLYGVSVQNEPDFVAKTYGSCIYSPTQMIQFIDILGPKLHSLVPPVTLIAPETETWKHLWGMYGTISQDPTANPLVGVYATHDYDYDAYAPPSGIAQPIWETEVADLAGAPSVSIDNGVAVARWIHNALTTGGASAWHHWWLVAEDSSTGNQGLLFQPGMGPGDAGDVNSPPKRYYAVGNFSKFVRPGYERIDSSGQVGDVLLTAFQSADAMNPTMVIVAVNPDAPDASATTLDVSISGGSVPAQFTPWVTSASENLAAQPPMTVVGGVLTAVLPPQSVTTFVSVPLDAGSAVADAGATDVDAEPSDAADAATDVEAGPPADAQSANDGAGLMGTDP